MANWRDRATEVSTSGWRSRATEVGQPTVESEPQSDISATEAVARGLKFGAYSQPTNVIGAGIASAFGPEGTTFGEYLQEANAASLEGRAGEAREQRLGYFTAGEIGGNIALTAFPAAKATSLIGKAAPLAANVPVIGKTLSNVAKGVGASKGLVGLPLAGGVQGGVQTAATQGDLSGVLPGMVGAGLVGGAGKLVKPLADDAVSAARKAYVKTLQRAGIDDLSAGQLTGNRNIELAESTLANMLPTAGAARDLTEGQLKKFTGAALKKAGIKSNVFTIEVREAAEDKFNKEYTDLVGDTLVKIDDNVLNSVVDLYDREFLKLSANMNSAGQSYVDDIFKHGDRMAGDVYQKMRSDLTKRANGLIVSDPHAALFVKELRNILDDAAELSLPESTKIPWAAVNRRYTNFKDLTKAISRTSNDSLEGLISPAALNSVVEAGNKTKSTKGYGELFDLARSGRAVLTDSIPNSGTAQRQFAQQLVTGGTTGGAVGLGTYAATDDPTLAMTSALTGSLLGPKAVQSFLNSGAGKTYFTKGVPGLNLLADPVAAQLGAQINTGLQKGR